MAEIENTYNNATVGTSFDIDQNDQVDNQLLSQFKRTYLPARLHFDDSFEQEDITEWMYLEPKRVRSGNIATHELLMTENCTEKENESEKIIKDLKRENIRLKQIIRHLNV